VPISASYPTPYPDVNAALGELLSGARAILGEHFVGMYLFGSLASGDFDPHSSDLDILFVPDAALSDEEFAALADMHARFIPLDALRRYDPARKLYPRVDRGNGILRPQSHDVDWVIQRHGLHEHGIALAGLDPCTLIDPVQPDDLRRATAELMHVWWGPMGDDPVRLYHRGYQAYTALTMCRVLYTLQHGAIVTKPVAARWALEMLDARWRPLIERALAWRKDQQDVLGDDVSETQELIRYTLARCEEVEPDGDT
jgi:hypothetical protein